MNVDSLLDSGILTARGQARSMLLVAPLSAYTKKVLSYSPTHYVPFDDRRGLYPRQLAGATSAIQYAGASLRAALGPAGWPRVASLDGVNDHVYLGDYADLSSFDGDTFTVMVWAKISSSALWSNGVRKTLWLMQADASNYILWQQAPGGHAYAYRTAAGTVRLVGEAATGYNDAWIHFALTSTGSGSSDTLTHYKNGSDIGNALNGNNVFAGTPDICRVGVNAAADANYWPGLVAHYAYWAGTALSPAQIADLASVS